MNAESAAGGTEYYSDDSSEYESEEEGEEGLNPYGTRATKEKIRRRGFIPLNLTSNYGRKSGWGVREGGGVCHRPPAARYGKGLHLHLDGR